MKFFSNNSRKSKKGFTRTPIFGVTPKGGGFTLIETLVAVSIFSVSILGLLVVLSGGIADTGYAKKKIIAAYLAQEGIEYMRNMRDTFVLYDPSGTQNGWNAFWSRLSGASCPAASGCYFDDRNLDYGDHSEPMKDILVVACGSSCPGLLYDGGSGKYGYVSGTGAGFIRQIRAVQVSPNEIKIFSTVSWVQSAGNSSMTFSESLFNWLE